MLRAVEAGGPEGVRPRDFSKRYFGDGTPAHVKCSGRLLHHCHAQGYVLRVGWRGDALHQLTDEGRAFLAGFWKRASPASPSVAGAPASSGGYGVVGDVVSAPRVQTSQAMPALAGGYGRVS